jgi:hypothetical protein
VVRASVRTYRETPVLLAWVFAGRGPGGFGRPREPAPHAETDVVMTDALNRLYDDVCRDFYAVLRENSMETRQTFFDQLAANIREVKAEMRVTTPRNED